MKWFFWFCHYIVALGTVGVLTLAVRLVVKRPLHAAAIACGIGCALVAAGFGDSGRHGPAWPDGLTPTVVIIHVFAALTVAAILSLYQGRIVRRRNAGLYWTAEKEEPKQGERRHLL
ncbi:hypothetical protein NVS55_12995 [Myxococcus stipitatus]|uniref:hypothetical protein n=1 Tax=Myxococcus stipitatus TaxID=83455 RepID=UPI003145443E